MYVTCAGRMIPVLGNLGLLEPPLRVSSPIHPVSLIESHFWSTKQGIVDSLDSQHELVHQPMFKTCKNELTE